MVFFPKTFGCQNGGFGGHKTWGGTSLKESESFSEHIVSEVGLRKVLERYGFCNKFRNKGWQRKLIIMKFEEKNNMIFTKWGGSVKGLLEFFQDFICLGGATSPQGVSTSPNHLHPARLNNLPRSPQSLHPAALEPHNNIFGHAC